MTAGKRTVLIPVAMALTIPGLTAGSTDVGEITHVQITGDADCGITADNTCTRTLDFGTDTPGALINGIQFES